MNDLAQKLKEVNKVKLKKMLSTKVAIALALAGVAAGVQLDLEPDHQLAQEHLLEPEHQFLAEKGRRWGRRRCRGRWCGRPQRQ